MLQKIKINSSFASLPEFKTAAEIISIFNQHGKKAYFVGGSVRDILLGKAPHDIDIATDALPDEVQQIFPENHAVGLAFGIVIVHRNGFQFETATFREERGYSDGRRPDKVFYTTDPQLDVERRDLTINGMLFDPNTGEVLDFVGGLRDLHDGIIRTIGDPRRRFQEDYLRILRTIRFTARFGFKLEPETRKAASEEAHNLTKLAAERIREELDKILLGPHPSEAFQIMLDTGILHVILPEIAALNGCEQPKEFHPEGDVFRHTMIMLEKMAHPTLELAWSVLLHDIGKPQTRSVKNGVPHFYGHEAIGAGIAEQILLRLKSPATLIRNVKTAVAGHMRFASVDKMRPATWKRLMASPTFATEMELHRIDCSSCHSFLQNYVLMLDRLRTAGTKPELPPPLITGNDLLRLGIRESPQLGMILNRIRDMQLDGELRTKEKALSLALEMKNKFSTIPEKQFEKTDKQHYF